MSIRSYKTRELPNCRLSARISKYEYKITPRFAYRDRFFFYPKDTP